MDVCRKNILGKGACLACLGKSEGLQGRECLEGTNRGGRYLGDEGGREASAHLWVLESHCMDVAGHPELAGDTARL